MHESEKHGKRNSMNEEDKMQ